MDSLGEVEAKRGGGEGRTRPVQLVVRVCSAAAILAGVVAVGWGDAWAPWAFSGLPEGAPGVVMEIFVPFLPIALVALGALGMVKSRR